MAQSLSFSISPTVKRIEVIAGQGPHWPGYFQQRIACNSADPLSNTTLMNDDDQSVCPFQSYILLAPIDVVVVSHGFFFPPLLSRIITMIA